MKYFDFTLPEPAANLACDEALLDMCEAGGEGEILRFWEPKTPFVVLGYANQAARETNLAACRAAQIPVLRRCSGGGTVLQGPGCLNYSLILEINKPSNSANADNRRQGATVSTIARARAAQPPPPGQSAAATARVAPANPLQSISATNQFILRRHQAALEPLLKRPVRIAGHTDLAAGNLKFSGNAQRRRSRFLIFHGTFLLHFDLSLVEKYLPMPSKQPGYREDRSHAEFLMNLEVLAGAVKAALRKIWGAEEALAEVPDRQINELVASRYSTEAWNLKF